MAFSRRRSQRSRRRPQQRPAWARTLDVVADVLLGVGVAVGLVVGLGALTTLVGTTDSGIGEWLTRTATTLAGPVPDLVEGWVQLDAGPGLTALGLGLAGLAWVAAGWLLSALLRPR